MGQRRGIPAGAAKLGERIEHWRKTRTKRSPMPEPLWDAAVELAKAHGVHRISEALRVNYDTLKARAARPPKRRTGSSSARAQAHSAGSSGARPPGFVELTTGDTYEAGAVESKATVVELRDARGHTLTIRYAAGAAVDLPGLVRAFQSRPA